MAERTEGERIAALESAYQHVATKADIANLRAEVKADIASLRTDFVSFQSEIRGAVRTMLRIIVITISILGIAVSALIYLLSQSGI